MKKIAGLLLLSTAIFTFSNCKEENEPVEKITPSNLVIEKTISEDGSGIVTFTATADNAVKFMFFFGEDLTAPPITSTDGTASHTYLNTGSYTVSVFAYSIDELFINKTSAVSVQVNDPVISNEGYTTPESYDGKTLVWQDEFSGDQLNTSNWTHEIGNNNGWGNNELEYYQAANTEVHDGYLVIKAKKESVGGFSYTSSRMVTKGKKEFKYGRIDIRAILPKGQGIWPALWMLGSNISTVNWPKCGEIDIMEMIGGTADREKTVFGTLHWDDATLGHVCTCDKPGHILSSGSFNDKFHVFTITWDETFITWYVDDVQFNKIDITPADLDEFQKDYFFIFNLAVGGSWPGNPNSSTVFPQRMIVDYVRVFQ